MPVLNEWYLVERTDEPVEESRSVDNYTICIEANNGQKYKVKRSSDNFLQSSFRRDESALIKNIIESQQSGAPEAPLQRMEIALKSTYEPRQTQE